LMTVENRASPITKQCVPCAEHLSGQKMPA
jgi:hypothetical protein